MVAMSLSRRRFLHAAAGAATLVTIPHQAEAQAYPSRSARFVVPSLPGGTPDILARLIAQWLSEQLGQPFVIENRPGAGTNIGTELVVRAPADGYTLLLVGPAQAINATLYDKLNFDFIHDIAPVAGISRERLVLVVNPSSPIKTVRELIANAAARPGTLNMASSGNGTGPHVAGELFKMMANVNIVHVPYRSGAPALTALLGGQVDLMFATMPAAIEHVRSGRLRALAVTTATRSLLLPDIPTVAEFLPGYEASSFFGVGVPRNTPAAIVEKLNGEINAALVDPKIKAQFERADSLLLGGSPSDFGRLVASETAKWAKVVKFAGIRSE